MFTINNTISAQPRINLQKRQSPLQYQLSQKDSIAFKAGEAEFLKHLRKLTKEGWNGFNAENVEAYAHLIDPNHPDIIKEFKEIKENPKIEKIVVDFVFNDLPEVFGKGGKDCEENAFTKTLDSFFGLFKSKKK